MSDPRAFIDTGLAAVSDALLEAVDRAGLHLKPETVTKTVRRRFRARLKQLTILVRRLLFLLALTLELAPTRPRPPAGRPVAPGGAEDVTARFGPKPRSLRLVPQPCRFSEPYRSAAGALPECPVAAAPLLAQWIAFHRLLAHPERAARHLARMVARWKARGEPKPDVPPLAGRHRLRPALGAIAGMLPGLLREALKDWPDTG